MSRGGWRPGGGRPPGIKETRPRRRKSPVVDSDATTIRQMLSMGTRAKAKVYQEFIRRIGRDEILTLAEKRHFFKLGEELAAEVGEEKLPEGVVAAADAEGLDPLAYMLKIMNDPKMPVDRRDWMAIAAAPFCHPRRGEAGTGKKDATADRAAKAGKGKFKASAPPVLKRVK